MTIIVGADQKTSTYLVILFFSMNIFEEYASRRKISYPIAYHANDSLLILKVDKNKWGSTGNWCVLSVFWDPNPHHPGTYNFHLRSTGFSNDQSILLLNKSHFTINRSSFDYEKFFYQWKPQKRGLFPVFGNDALLAAWEIFVCSYEKHFLNRTSFIKEKFFATMNPESSCEARLSSCEYLISLESFSNIKGIWNDKFLLPVKQKYLSWFKNFCE